MKKLKYSTLLLFIITLATNAQTLNLQEAAKVAYNNSAGSPSGAFYVITNGFVLDNEGNRYVTGRYRGNFDFDPGPSVVSRPTGSNYDIFAMKLNKNDELLWVKFWGVTTNNDEEMLSVAVDNNKNVIITGQFREEMDFDPGDGTFNMSNGAVAAGYKSLFMLKLNASGDFQWAKNFQASAANTMLFRSLNMSCDANNNILATGHFSGTVDFDPNAGAAVTTAIIADGGVYDAFLLKMDTDGNYVFSQQLVFGWEGEYGYSALAHASGNVYVLFGGQNSVGTQSRTQVNKYTATGLLQMSYTKNSFGFTKMAIDNNGNAFIKTEENLIKINGNTGAELWIKPIKGSNISIDNDNNIVCSGSFSFNNDFDPSTTSSFIINRIGNTDGFVSKMDNDGNFIWAYQFASVPSANAIIIRQSINQNNEIWLWGYFTTSVDVDPGPGTLLYTSAATGFNPSDGWVGKYCDCEIGPFLVKNTSTNVSYLTLQAAIDAANPNETLTLLDNISENLIIDESVTIQAGDFMLTIPVSLTIQTGKTLVWPAATLTINASASIINNGTFKNNGTINSQGGTFTNTGVYSGSGIFNGNFVNNGQINPSN
jgi:hypothetical protein